MFIFFVLYYKLVYIFVSNKIQTMKENKRTNKNQNYNGDVLNTLQAKFGYSYDYIIKCLKGDRKGLMPDTIVKEYGILDKAAKKAIKEAAKIN